MSRYLDLFVSEARQHLQDAEKEVDRLAGAPSEGECLQALFRHFHSLKGMAASMGFSEIARLSHAVEDLFDEVRKDPGRAARPGLGDLVLEALDALSALVEIASAGSREFPPQSPLIDRFEAHARALRGEAPPPEEPARGAAPTEDPAPPAHPPASVYRCRLQIDPGAELPAARAALVIRQMESLGTVLTTTPARETLGRAPFDGTVTALLSTPLPRARVAAAIEEMIDVASYALTEELLPTESASRKEPGVREAEPGLPATIRIPTAALDHFLDTLGELITWRGGLCAALRQKDLQSAEESYGRLGRAIDRLREEVMEIRLLPFEHIVPHLNQSVRALARQTAKRVALQISGTDVAIDRAVLEEILDPLNHILRNAVDHGIEPPDARVAAGKDPTGRIVIAVSREGDRVRIRIEDDGRGMDADAIVRKAIQDGFVSPQGAAALGPEEILMLTTIPGFSTAAATTEISGRGVGMDVVRTRIEKLDGRLSLQSGEGTGLTVLLDLPLTVAVIEAFLVEAAGSVFAVPASVADRTLHAFSPALRRSRGVLYLEEEDGALLAAFRLDEALGMGSAERSLPPRFPVVLFRTEGARGAIVVDRILERRELVVKPLGEPLDHLLEYSGAALLDDGRIALILDVPNLAQAATGA